MANNEWDRNATIRRREQDETDRSAHHTQSYRQLAPQGDDHYPNQDSMVGGQLHRKGAIKMNTSQPYRAPQRGTESRRSMSYSRTRQESAPYPPVDANAIQPGMQLISTQSNYLNNQIPAYGSGVQSSQIPAYGLGVQSSQPSHGYSLRSMQNRSSRSMSMRPSRSVRPQSTYSFHQGTQSGLQHLTLPQSTSFAQTSFRGQDSQFSYNFYNQDGQHDYYDEGPQIPSGLPGSVFKGVSRVPGRANETVEEMKMGAMDVLNRLRAEIGQDPVVLCPRLCSLALRSLRKNERIMMPFCCSSHYSGDYIKGSYCMERFFDEQELTKVQNFTRVGMARWFVDGTPWIHIVAKDYVGMTQEALDTLDAIRRKHELVLLEFSSKISLEACQKALWVLGSDPDGLVYMNFPYPKDCILSSCQSPESPFLEPELRSIGMGLVEHVVGLAIVFLVSRRKAERPGMMSEGLDTAYKFEKQYTSHMSLAPSEVPGGYRMMDYGTEPDNMSVMSHDFPLPSASFLGNGPEYTMMGPNQTSNLLGQYTGSESDIDSASVIVSTSNQQDEVY